VTVATQVEIIKFAGAEALQGTLNRAQENIPKLRAHLKSATSSAQSDFDSPFTNTVRLCNELNTAEAFGLPVSHEGIAHVMPREQFGHMMAAALDQELASQQQVGESKLPVDAARLRQYTDNMVTAYAYGLNAKDYVDVMAGVLKKADQHEEEKPENRLVRNALVRILNGVSQEISQSLASERIHG
jgi:hypothetical protein